MIIDDLCCKDHAVKPVQYAAVPRQQPSVVLDAVLPLDAGEAEIAQLPQHPGHVEALAAGGQFARHTVAVVDNELIELIARIDRRVHRNGEDHF